ncbi:hypothetical protein BDN70DRAFT_976568 [Pholiota conissans]|uniref:Uncharacterized protein n=1 Tax=Pholiota conissans TaxID=109636 RepID=A0A9P5YKB1_9AGAR|nr:hypothetical protein BDN70DRAFT_976568 [Pholiota conissans]
MTDSSGALVISKELERLLELSDVPVQAEFNACIPQDRAPAASFWKPYKPEQVTIGLLACFTLWIASSGHLVPRDFQIQATIAPLSGQDCLVDVGTAYGKKTQELQEQGQMD